MQTLSLNCDLPVSDDSDSHFSPPVYDERNREAFSFRHEMCQRVVC